MTSTPDKSINWRVLYIGSLSADKKIEAKPEPELKLVHARSDAAEKIL